MAHRKQTSARRLKWVVLLLLLGAGVVAVLDWRWLQRERRYDAVILTAARRHGVDPALLKAVVWRESRFDADAVGRVGELGLMQITEDAALEWAGEQGIAGFDHQSLRDPGSNTLCGAWYLSRLVRRYQRTDDALPYALADYNAGRGNVLRWAKGEAATNSTAFLAAMTFPGTRDYVNAILARRGHYTNDFASLPAVGTMRAR